MHDVKILSLIKSAGQAPKHPICFLTNGGGVTESMKAKQLSEWLGIRVQANQVQTCLNKIAIETCTFGKCAQMRDSQA